MVQLVIDGSNVRVLLSCWEMTVGGLCCCSLNYPISSISSVRVSNQMWADLRGIRVGLGVPYVVMLGSRLHGQGKDFAYVSGKMSGVIIEFKDRGFKRWCICIEHPEEFVSQLQKKIEEDQKVVHPHKVVDEAGSPLKKDF